MNYNKMIDHTVLKADTPLETVKRICDEAMEYGFASVCINPCHVAYCADYLKDSDVNVCTVIGFPLGASTSAVKAFEAKDAIANGADEIDMVINIGALKSRNLKLVEDDIKAVKYCIKTGCTVIGTAHGSSIYDTDERLTGLFAKSGFKRAVILEKCGEAGKCLDI